MPLVHQAIRTDDARIPGRPRETLLVEKEESKQRWTAFRLPPTDFGHFPLEVACAFYRARQSLSYVYRLSVRLRPTRHKHERGKGIPLAAFVCERWPRS